MNNLSATRIVIALIAGLLAGAAVAAVTNVGLGRLADVLVFFAVLFWPAAQKATPRVRAEDSAALAALAHIASPAHAQANRLRDARTA